jgi:hypothetical protein
VALKTGLDVEPDSVYWMAPRLSTGLGATLTWYDLVFLARERPGEKADVYRAAARTVDGKRLFALRGLRNLSSSPAGDDGDMVVDAPLAAVATRTFGHVTSVTIYNFNGVSQNGGAGGPRQWLTRCLETGRGEGVARSSVHFESPAKRAKLAFQGGRLVMDWVDLHGERSRSVVSPGAEPDEGAPFRVINAVSVDKPPLIWLVDTVRSLPFVGPGPIAWAEGRFFAVTDGLKRLKYRLFGDPDDAADSAVAESPRVEDNPPLPSGIEVGEAPASEVWPPPPFDPPVFKKRKPGEGVWRSGAPAFVRRFKNAPPAIVSSVVRPDRERPYVLVRLFAMDMRQLELHMVGGTSDPHATTGAAGTGRLPRKKAVMDKVVAAFNGAFKTMHGEYGMMVERNVLLPPVDGSATIVSLENGNTAMGSWPAGRGIPGHVVSYRQNVEPLVENQVINPKRVRRWGITLGKDLTRVHTVRSGVCVADEGYMVYAWGEDVSAETLGVAMNAAGCAYGMHLDMNPYHTAFIYYRLDLAEDDTYPAYEAELGSALMRYSTGRYVNRADKDFFFLTLRDARPGPAWTSESLAQPAPAFVPSVFKREVDGCTLLAVDTTRTAVVLQPGDLPAGATPRGTNVSKTRDDLLLIEACLGPWSASRGQIVSDTIVAGLKKGRATLGVDETGALRVHAWPFPQGTPRVENIVQGGFLDEAPADAAVLAVGLGDKHVFLGYGPAAALAALMKEENVARPLSFAITNGEFPENALAVRGAEGMVDAAGNPVSERDGSAARLVISAAPRPLGTAPLASVFAKAPPGTPPDASQKLSRPAGLRGGKQASP